MKFVAAMKLVMITAVLSGCTISLDPYADRWPSVRIGDASATAIKVLGAPSSVTSIEVPLASVSQLAWRSYANGRVYVVHTLFDKVITKSVIQ